MCYIYMLCICYVYVMYISTPYTQLLLTLDTLDGRPPASQGHSFMTRSVRCAKRDIDKLRSNLRLGGATAGMKFRIPHAFFIMVYPINLIIIQSSAKKLR